MQIQDTFDIAVSDEPITLEIRFDDVSERVLQQTVQDLYMLREVPSRVDDSIIDWRRMALFNVMVDEYIANPEYNRVQDAKDACTQVVLRRMRQDIGLQFNFIKEQALRLALLGGNLTKDGQSFYLVDAKDKSKRVEIPVLDEWFDDSAENERLLQNHMLPKPIREKNNPVEQRVAIINWLLKEHPNLRRHVVSLIQNYFNDAVVDAIMEGKAERTESFLE